MEANDFKIQKIGGRLTAIRRNSLNEENETINVTIQNKESSEETTGHHSIRRTEVLQIDPRLFPQGIRPGNLIQVRGSSGSGKSFLFSYIISRFLANYETKSVLLISTFSNFSLENLKSILSFIDPLILTHSNPNYIEKYLSRLFILSPTSISQFLSLFLPLYHKKRRSKIEELLLENSGINLLIVDGVDNFLYGDVEETWSILELLKKGTKSTNVPILVSQRDFYVGSNEKDELKVDENGANESRLLSSLRLCIEIDENFYTHSLRLLIKKSRKIPNYLINQSPIFEKIRLEKLDGIEWSGEVDEIEAYLSPTPKFLEFSKFSSESKWSHRVKFSIFSSMLWFLANKEFPEVKESEPLLESSKYLS